MGNVQVGSGCAVAARPSATDAKRRTSLRAVFDALAGRVLDDESWRAAAAKAAAVLGVAARPVRDSLEPARGRPWSLAASLEASWRLAGNRWRLVEGRVVPTWTRQPLDERVPFAFADVSPSSARDGLAWTFKGRVLAGLAAGHWFEWRFGHERLRSLSVRLGMATWDEAGPKARRLESPLDLVGCGGSFLVRAGTAGSDQLRPVAVECPSGARTANQELSRRRDRLQSGAPCPARKPAHAPCRECPAGARQCGLAVRLLPAAIDVCDKCGEARLLASGQSRCWPCRERSGGLDVDAGGGRRGR